jgi:hypothetical protein
MALFPPSSVLRWFASATYLSVRLGTNPCLSRRSLKAKADAALLREKISHFLILISELETLYLSPFPTTISHQ